MNDDLQWLQWATRIQAIAQTGLAYTTDVYDRERFEELRELAGEILAQYSDTPKRSIANILQGETGYACPKVDVRGVVFDDVGRILLVKERQDGLWTLPGGWADIHESPAENVAKEIEQESGYTAVPERLLAVWDREKHDHPPSMFHIYKLFFLCRLTGGEARESLETAGAEFFALEALPELSLSRVNPTQIARLAVLAQNPGAATEFD